MSRYLGPMCRLCRAEGVKLMSKGPRCESAKCPMEKQWRSSPPGAHAWRRRKPSGYGIRLREKQKVKRYYGILERQFARVFRQAERAKGNTGEALLSLLERRLDNAVWKAGFAASRRTARCMVGHGHVRVNDRRVDRPGFLVRPGDRITIKPSERSEKAVRGQLELTGARVAQPWLQVNPERLEVAVAGLPTPDDVQIPVEVQLIVELCSR